MTPCDTRAERPAFEITFPGGCVGTIYASGRIDGFGDVQCIINRIPAMIAEEAAKQTAKIEKMKTTLPWQPMTIGDPPKRDTFFRKDAFFSGTIDPEKLNPQQDTWDPNPPGS